MTGHTAVVFKSNFNVNTGGFGCPVTPNISKKIYKYNEGFDLIQNVNVFSLKTTVFLQKYPPNENYVSAHCPLPGYCPP